MLFGAAPQDSPMITLNEELGEIQQFLDSVKEDLFLRKAGSDRVPRGGCIANGCQERMEMGLVIFGKAKD